MNLLYTFYLHIVADRTHLPMAVRGPPIKLDRLILEVIKSSKSLFTDLTVWDTCVDTMVSVEEMVFIVLHAFPFAVLTIWNTKTSDNHHSGKMHENKHSCLE